MRVRGQPEEREPSEKDSDRRTLIAVAIVFLLGVAASVAYFRMGAKPASPLARVAAPIPLPAKEETSQESQDRLWKASSPENMAFADFAPLIGLTPDLDPLPDPNLEAFGSAILGDPLLNEDVKEFRRLDSRGKRPLARSLLERLERRPQYQSVAAQFAAKPEFAEALKALLQGPKGAEAKAVIDAIGAEPDPELIENLKKKLKRKPSKKKKKTSDFAALVASLGAEQFEAISSSFTVKVTSDAIPTNDPGEDPHKVKENVDAMEHAVTERIKRFLEVYPWLKPLGLANLHRLEEAAPLYGLYGACFSQLLHFQCWSACKSDPTGRCLADANT
ncbi:MAG: hypothetical protein FD126_3221, partial [Elusimicrobia bacterium]